MPGTPIGPHTRFDLASLTKPIATTTLLAQEVAAGRIALHGTVADYLPDATGTAAAPLTVGDLLAHCSGWPAWHDFFAQTNTIADRVGQAALIRRLVLATQPVAPPRQCAVYSDLGFMTLGWILETVCGAPLDQLLALRVARPLGIAIGFRRLSQAHLPQSIVATEIWPPRCPDGRPLQGQVHDDNCAGLDGVAGHAGMFGSAHDVALWAQQWLNASRGTTGALALDPALGHHWTATGSVAGSSWRHGWDSPTQPGSTAGSLAPLDTFGHLGFTGTSVWCSSQHAVAVVLLTNRVHPSRAAVAPIKALRVDVHDLLWQAIVGGAPKNLRAR